MKSKIRVLAIDGGGIRGVIPARILIHVEEILQEISRNKQAKISDFFDLVAGTSTGGILTALILSPDSAYEAKDMLELYRSHGQDIFTRTATTRFLDRLGLFHPLYQHNSLEMIFDNYLGNTKMSQLTRPALIPTYNIETGEATFVSGVEISKSFKSDRLVKDVLRATTAAPTYFTPSWQQPDAFIDGGMFANNPALCAYVEATKFPSNPKPNEIMILSLGTGSINQKYPYEKAKGWGRLHWIRPALEIYASSSSQTVHHQLQMLYKHKGLEGNYLRIEPDLDEFEAAKSMDMATAENIDALCAVGAAMCEKYDEKLRTFLFNVVQSNVMSSHEKLYEQKEE